MTDMKINSGIGVTIIGVIVWAFFGVWFAEVHMAKADGFVGASAYGPTPMNYGPSGILLIVGIVITAIGIALAIVGLKERRLA